MLNIYLGIHIPLKYIIVFKGYLIFSQASKNLAVASSYFFFKSSDRFFFQSERVIPISSQHISKFLLVSAITFMASCGLGFSLILAVASSIRFMILSYTGAEAGWETVSWTASSEVDYCAFPEQAWTVSNIKQASPA